ncbi:peptidoglycan D,D-transpeptidase FtsI family protein [Leucothrix pacifica]|nr:penicillin-binding protein 2 [Leucothrix pacifica]
MTVTRRKSQNAKISPVYRGRRLVLLMVLLAGMAVMLVRAGYLEIFQQTWLQAQADKRQMRTMTVPPYRGQIIDRNNDALAISSPVETIWTDPRKFWDVRNNLRKAIAEKDEDSAAAQDKLDDLDVNLQKAEALLSMTSGELTKLLTDNKTKRFVRLAVQAPPELAQDIADLNIPAIGSHSEYRRFYPMAESVAHVVGFTNIDDSGVEGIELSMNQELAGKAGEKRVIQDGAARLIEDVEQVERMVPGQDVQLSIDRRIQYQAYKVLKEQVTQLSAKAGSVVVLDARSGEVLAMANMPGFNPNARGSLKPENYRNRALMDAYEPGSTLKPLTLAAALEARVIGTEVSIDTNPGKLKLGKTTVTDPRNYGTLTLDMVLAKSSNVGASKVALLMDAKDHWMFLNRVGLGLRPDSGAPAETNGSLSYYDKWGEVDRASHGYGYGVSVSLLQLAQAYTIFANEGVMYPAKLIRQTEEPVGQRIMKPENARAVLRMMTAVVKEGATGRRAMIDGYTVAGKTGTAFKYINKKYRKDRKVVSFIGLAPASDPRLIVAIMMDEPRVERANGGRLVAPMFSKIMSSSLRVLDIPPDDLPKQRASSKTNGGAS